MTKKPHILLIYTGGTIGMARDYDTGVLKAFNFNDLLSHIPELKRLNCTIENTSFEVPIDSSNMNPKYWVQIVEMIERNYNQYDGFVVLHGSDTMSFTASAVSFMLEDLNKPIIFTGSQLPIGDFRTDAKENLITAIEIASSHESGVPIIKEVCLYFEYKLYRGNRTTKVNSEHFKAFSSPNLPPLAESGVHMKFNKALIKDNGSKNKVKFRKQMDTNVVLLKLFPGISERIIKSIFEIDGLKGIIIETYGSGNAPTDDWFITLLKKALENGIKIIDVTQCVSGEVLFGHYETSAQLEKLGLINGKDITTESAIAKLMYLLGENVEDNEFKRLFEAPLRGEMKE
ncbi:asparaginase [Urechidicola croceus]|uniref:asparaginase n=1 Tax=Urechidicola croceus TaxID=1850246 RepID=A0A1D8PA29_9FLAO|nr:asparaginase [Urechidicola croceus]AOW21449.1 L-asparaginase 1 [Urechidicola croceus]